MLGWLTARVLCVPWLSAALLCALTLVAGSKLPALRTEFGYRPLVGAEHPSIRRLESFIDRFGGGFPIRIAWSCQQTAQCEHALDPGALRMAHQIEQQIAGLAAVRSTRSPASAAILVPEVDGFSVRRLVEDEVVSPDAAELARRALVDPLWTRVLVSPDGSVGVVIVQPIDSESGTSVAVVEAIQAAIEPFERQGTEFHLVGHAIEFVIAGRELAASSAALTPVTALVIALVLLWLTGSWQATVATLLSLGVALIWTFGALAALDWPQDSILQTLAPLVLVAGVCDAMHLLSQTAAADAGAERSERRAAWVRAAREVSAPCLITTLTTAGAFLSFATSDLQTFVHFGVIAALGVIACLVATFTVLPPLMLWLPSEGARARGASAAWEAALASIVRTASRRRDPILGATALLFVVWGVGWFALLRVDTDGYEMYGEDSRVVRWIRFVEGHLGRSDNLELEIALPADALVEGPETLSALDGFTQALGGIQGLGPAVSLLDPLGRLNRVLHDDDPAYERAARSAVGNAELIELIGFEDPSLLESWLSFDRSRIRISVEAEFQSHAEREQVLGAVRQKAGLLPDGWQTSLTGAYAMGHDWVSAVQTTQLRSFATALAIVFVLLLAYLRSIPWSLAALIPTLLPVFAILGSMGLLGLSLDVGRSMIAAVILGIGVDDTIHLLDRFRRGLDAGLSREHAIRKAVETVGRPVITTSLALSLGFLSLMMSSWQTVSSFGFFVGMGIVIALLADLFVLPALVSTRAFERAPA